jgi:hypothetical protein
MCGSPFDSAWRFSVCPLPCPVKGLPLHCGCFTGAA